MIPAKHWQDICARAGRTVISKEIRVVQEMESPPHQLVWGMQQYAKQTVYPNLADFEEWLGRQELPEEIVCAAYLSGEPEIIRLADTLETLQGAWFPDPDTESEVEDVKRRLGAALL